MNDHSIVPAALYRLTVGRSEFARKEYDEQ